MKRHEALVPLSHDHHHALVEARLLRRAAEGDATGRLEAATAFLRFFDAETIEHFREEEERLFPLLVAAGEPPPLLVEALLDHQRIHALAAVLRRQCDGGEVTGESMGELGELLEQHVRLEERQLFPLLEALSQEALARVELGRTSVRGSGPVWGTETGDLNVTLLEWSAGGGTPEHVNAQRDVVVVVLAGSATVTLDGEPREVGAGEWVVLEQGRSRQIAAGPEGARYLSIHRRRAPLQVTRRGRA